MATRHPRIHSKVASAGLGIACLAATFVSAAEQPANANLALHDSTHEVVFLDEAWISDIGALLYSDPDADGYFSGVSLSIDADTTFNTHEVYLHIDIIGNFSDSAESAAISDSIERLHTTRNFELYGNDSFDEYHVDIDLVKNYAPGIFDLQLTLVDAHDDRVLDQVGSRDFRNLRGLSLESEEHQSVFIPVVERPVLVSNDDVRVTEYAGASGLGLTGLFCLILLSRIRSGQYRNKQPGF